MQQKIKYSEIIALGFKEEEVSDNRYFEEFGFPYCLITLELTKKIYLEWAKETQLCQMVRIKDKKNCDIIKCMPIKDLQHLREIIDFFSDKKVEKIDYTFVA